MNHQFNVAVDQVILSDFREELETAHQDIERIVITLETAPDDRTLLQTLRDTFHALWVSSVKLDMAPLSESLNDTLRGLDLMLTRRTFPPRMAEFILLLVDRLLMLAREVERNQFIDIRKTQHLLVALQLIVLTKASEDFRDSVERAITAITRDISDNLDEPTGDCDIVLFDDDSADETPTHEENPVELFIPQASLNPLAHARGILEHYRNDDALALIIKISDLNSHHGKSHTYFLAELALAVNVLAGEPIDHDGLFKGICFHDIGLAAIPHITGKSGRLSEEERQEIRHHPLAGARAAHAFTHCETAELTVVQHHERLDGKGYPYGLKNGQISDAGKLTAIVDSFHAMIDQRPHRRYSKSTLRAVAEINACVDTQYDKYWIKLFNTCIREYWLPERKDQTLQAALPAVSGA